jgi:hypothetical protein
MGNDNSCTWGGRADVMSKFEYVDGHAERLNILTGVAAQYDTASAQADFRMPNQLSLFNYLLKQRLGGMPDVA